MSYCWDLNLIVSCACGVWICAYVYGALNFHFSCILLQLYFVSLNNSCMPRYFEWQPTCSPHSQRSLFFYSPCFWLKHFSYRKLFTFTSQKLFHYYPQMGFVSNASLFLMALRDLCNFFKGAGEASTTYAAASESVDWIDHFLGNHWSEFIHRSNPQHQDWIRDYLSSYLTGRWLSFKVFCRSNLRWCCERLNLRITSKNFVTIGSMAFCTCFATWGTPNVIAVDADSQDPPHLSWSNLGLTRRHAL
jgi:hypothetical protein